MAYVELIREDDPETLYCATFFLGRAGNVVPGGYWDSPEEALPGLVHVLEARDVHAWAPRVASIIPVVLDYMKQNASLTWVRFDVPEHEGERTTVAIAGMTAGCSVRRQEEYLTKV